MTHAPGARRARQLVRPALGLLGALLALGVIESGARLVADPPNYGPSMIHDPRLGFRLTPGKEVKQWDERGVFSFRLNRAGFRGRDLPEPDRARPAGVLRLLFIGDSFLHAAAVRDEDLVSNATVHALAERSILAEAYDLGCPDYGTLQELILLEEYGARAAPDVVVLLVFPGNDVANNCLELAGCTSGNHRDYLRPYFVPGEELRFAHPWRAFLRHRLRTFAVLESDLLTLAHERGWSWPTMWGDRECPPIGGVLQPPAEGDVWSTAWHRTETLLGRFRDEVTALGADLLVLVVPQRNQVQREGVTSGFDPDSVAGLDWNYPERRLQTFLAREGIAAILLLEDLRAAIASDPTPVYARDFHLAARAHRIAAGRVAGWVEARRSGRDVAPAPAPSGGPVDLLSPERCQEVLDFGAAPRLEFLVEGFGAWHPDWSGKGAGVPIARRAVLVLRRGRGDFVVRGWAAVPPKRLPLVLELAFDERPLERSFEITQRGPFDLSVPRAELPAGLPLRTEVTLRVRSANDGEFDPLRTLILREIGFRE